MNEIWKEIPGFETYYEVSDLGNVRSLRYHGTTRKKPRIIVGAISKNGYRKTLLYNADQKRFTKMVHVVALESFVGPRPSTKHHAAHLNGNRLDNRIENLAWVTAKENMRHRDEHGTTMHGLDHHSSKLNPEKVIKIRQMHLNGVSLAELGRMFGVNETNIKKVVTRRTWKRVL
jgi:HNH endonuclease/NUMOD4 motif